MSVKKVPFPEDVIRSAMQVYGSPLYLYDVAGIQSTANDLKQAFSWAKGYRNFFAVKATPTPGLLKVLADTGMGFDCSSRAELLMVQKMGVPADQIYFSSNNTPREDFELAIELGATINLDDLSFVDILVELLGDQEYEKVSFRYNPGPGQGGNDLIGVPVDAKYGMRLDQMVEGYKKLASQANIKEFGLHTMVVSNELNADYFDVTIKLLKEALTEIELQADVKISSVNIGGGLGIPYELDEEPLDLQKVADYARDAFAELDIEFYTEFGRYVTGPHGYLASTVRHVMDKYKQFAGLDASMADLMRPAMYGAYHHITVLGKENLPADVVYDVVGSLCENNDKFAIERNLPKLNQGDVLVLHDVGAHGHAMGFNYNGTLRHAEVLLYPDGKTELIRRSENYDDLFATLIW